MSTSPVPNARDPLLCDLFPLMAALLAHVLQLDKKRQESAK